MSPPSHAVEEVVPPPTCGVAPWYPAADLVDAFAVDLPAACTNDPVRLARFVFAAQPAWVAGLLRLRDALVRPFGIRTSRQLQAHQAAAGAERVGIFRLYATHAREAVLGEDDSHLDFRVSVLRQVPAGTDQGANARLVVTTVVRCHNARGRAYIALIRPFHRRVVIASLGHAARRGWPES